MSPTTVWFASALTLLPLSLFAQSPADHCSIVSASRESWQVVDAGPFSFRLPAEYRRVEVQGIDSLVGRWELSPQHQVSFDWGPFSDDLRQAPRILQDAVECTEPVDGFAARLVMGLDAKGIWGPSRVPKFVVAAAWREIGALTFVATGSNAKEAATLLAIIRSVVFKK